MESALNNKGNLLYIDYLRVFAVISLVIWHCFFCPELWWKIADYSLVSNNCLRLLSLSSSFFIPQANMPLFTFISGYVFAYVFKKGGYASWGGYFIKKCKRLLIPFFVLGTIISLSSYSDDSAKIGFKWMVYGSGSHLWYIIMLFWISITAWYVQQRKLRVLGVLLFIASLLSPMWMSLIGISVLPWGLHNSILYYCHFVLGIWLFNYSFSHKINYRFASIILSIAYCGLFIYVRWYLIESNIASIFSTIKSICFYVALFSVVNCFIEVGLLKENVFIQNVSKYSFGIYVFHHWIGWNLYHIDNVIAWLSNYYIPISVLITIGIFVLSYYLTKFSLRSTIGKYLLS